MCNKIIQRFAVSFQILSEGWACNERKNVRLTEEQKQFILEKITFREATGQKQTIEQVQCAVRIETWERKKIFYPEVYLSRNQIQSLIILFAKQQR